MQRGWPVAMLLASLLVVAVGAVLYLRNPLVRPAREGRQEGHEVLELNLGQGGDRGGQTVLVLAAPAGPREVTLDFIVPITPDALYEVEVRGPARETLIRYERAPIVLDDLGGGQVRVPASRFTESGDYELVIRQFALDSGVRDYRFPFRVKLQ